MTEISSIPLGFWLEFGRTWIQLDLIRSGLSGWNWSESGRKIWLYHSHLWSWKLRPDSNQIRSDLVGYGKDLKLLMVCFEFEISQVDVDNLETGFQSWVMDYEWCIFLFLLYAILIRLPDYTINMIQSVLHAVRWPFMRCYILPRLSGQWVQSGLIGPSQWNGIVEILDII